MFILAVMFAVFHCLSYDKPVVSWYALGATLLFWVLFTLVYKVAFLVVVCLAVFYLYRWIKAPAKG